MGQQVHPRGRPLDEPLRPPLQRAPLIRDAFKLRRNAYRVLLTRARDATVGFVGPILLLDDTYSHLVGSGFRRMLSEPPWWTPAGAYASIPTREE